MVRSPQMRTMTGALVLSAALIFLAMPLVRFARRDRTDAGRIPSPGNEAVLLNEGGECAGAPTSAGLPAGAEPLGGTSSAGRIGLRPTHNPFVRNLTATNGPLGGPGPSSGGVEEARLPADAPAASGVEDAIPILQGIVSGDSPAACLDGSIVSVGDTIRGWVVQRIDPRAVRLRGSGGRILILEEP